MSRKAAPVVLTIEEKKTLESLVNSRTAPYRKVQRARLVLLAAEGMTNTAIAQEVELWRSIVVKWRQRFLGERCICYYNHRNGASRANPQCVGDAELDGRPPVEPLIQPQSRYNAAPGLFSPCVAWWYEKFYLRRRTCSSYLPPLARLVDRNLVAIWMASHGHYTMFQFGVTGVRTGRVYVVSETETVRPQEQMDILEATILLPDSYIVVPSLSLYNCEDIPLSLLNKPLFCCYHTGRDYISRPVFRKLDYFIQPSRWFYSCLHLVIYDIHHSWAQIHRC